MSAAVFPAQSEQESAPAPAQRLRSAAARVDHEGASWRDRSTGALLRAMSLRTATEFVMSESDGTMRMCCDLGDPCDAHKAAFVVADAILGS